MKGGSKEVVFPLPRDPGRVHHAPPVFVVGGMPDATFVSRERNSVESILITEVNEGHKAILLAGPSGLGKTTLCKKVLKNEAVIWVDGSRVRSVADLQAEMSGWSGDRIEPSDKGSCPSLESELARLKVVAGGRNLVLVIDDFHVVPADVRTATMRAIKPLLYDGLCAILIGVRSDRFPEEFSPDISGRTAVIDVPRWSRDELAAIGESGFRQLGLSVPDEVVRELAARAAGSPLRMQRLCSRLHAFQEMQGAEVTSLSGEVRHFLFGEDEAKRERLLVSECRTAPPKQTWLEKVLKRMRIS